MQQLCFDGLKRSKMTNRPGQVYVECLPHDYSEGNAIIVGGRRIAAIN